MRERISPPFLPQLKRAIPYQSDGGGEFRLIESRLQAADRTGFAEGGGQLEHPLRQLVDPWDARSPSAEEDPCAQVLEQPGLAQVVLDEFEKFFQPQRHDPPQMLDVAALERQPQLIVLGNGEALVLVFDQRRAVFDLES